MFEQGSRGNALHWTAVLSAVSKLTRACVYDRAGYGLSDAPSRPLDAQNVSSDLHALLKADHISGPVVLVGHSIGGLYTTLYADRFPTEVAGLVLVDPSFAGMVGLKPETPEEVAMLKGREADDIAQTVRCAGLARQKLLTDADMKGCMPPTRPGRSPAEIAYLRSPYQQPGYYDAILSEGESVGRVGVTESADFREEREAQRSWGSMPVVVLTHGDDGLRPPGISDSRWNAAEADGRAGHEQLAARSTRGRHMVVAGAGHAIQIDKPEAVVSAIAEVVQATRQR